MSTKPITIFSKVAQWLKGCWAFFCFWARVKRSFSSVCLLCIMTAMSPAADGLRDFSSFPKVVRCCFLQYRCIVEAFRSSSVFRESDMSRECNILFNQSRDELPCKLCNQESVSHTLCLPMKTICCFTFGGNVS